MNVKEAVRGMMKDRKFTSVSLSRKLGYAQPSGILARLNGKNSISVELLKRFCDAMDYEVVIRSKLDKTEFVIDEFNKRE